MYKSDALNIPVEVQDMFRGSVKAWHHKDLLCFIYLNNPGRNNSWYCGYIVLPPNHPDHGKSWDTDLCAIPIKINIGRDLTFGEFDEFGSVYGFACNHSWDVRQNRDIKYVTDVCNSLADQLSKRSLIEE